MKLFRLFAIVAATLTLCTVSARAEDHPPGSPAPASPAAPAPAAAHEKPAARREDIEPKTLTEAMTALKITRADRDHAETDLAAESEAHGKTKALLKSTNEIATKAKADLDTANTNLLAMTGERDREKTAHAKTKENLTLMEGALGVHGVSPATAVKSGAEEKAKPSISHTALLAELQNATTLEARAALVQTFKTAVEEKRLVA